MSWFADDVSGIIGIICILGFIGIILYFLALSGVGIDIWNYVSSGFGYIFTDHNATSVVTGVL